ncbi:acyltransferase [Pseudomonas sp. NFXW11]|uniref:acyltransferase family protein n=1 Tax=Pseudomonas sp. NFXW11 TaxID=2819531 RepID=UPI003CF25E7D
MTTRFGYDLRENHLDGLRGWAAIFVLVSHLRPLLPENFKIPRIFFADGMLAVSIFFVLSGYVLSIGFYRNTSKRRVIDLAVRRYPRLAIPVLFSCLLTYALLNLNAFYNIEAAKITGNKDWLPVFFHFTTSITEVFRYSLYEIFIDPLATPSFNPVLWTMSFELAGSFIVLGILLLCGKNKYAQLTVPAIFLAVATIYESHFSGFAYGMIIAQLTAKSHSNWNKGRIVNTLLIVALTLALYVASKRELADNALLLPVCAAICVFCIHFCQVLRSFFSMKISTWLGALSFPIYLTHILVLFSISSWFIVKANEFNISPEITATSTILISVFCSTLVAIAFKPIESTAIKLSRKISKTILYARSSNPLEKVNDA